MMMTTEQAALFDARMAIDRAQEKLSSCQCETGCKCGAVCRELYDVQTYLDSELKAAGVPWP